MLIIDDVYTCSRDRFLRRQYFIIRGGYKFKDFLSRLLLKPSRGSRHLDMMFYEEVP